MSKRILSIILALLLAALPLVGCSETTTTTADDSTEAADDTVTASDAAEAEVTEEADEDTSRSSISDDLPDRDFNGQSFRALVTDTKEYQYRVEELTGEVTNDAVYNRNVTIEDRFNVKIETVIDSAPYDSIKNYVTSGDDACDVVDHYEYKAYVPILANCYLDWNTIPYIDQSKPWWNQQSNENSTINGKLFCIVGDLSISSLMYTFAEFFDADLLEQYGYTLDDMYNMVFEGTWTLDKLHEIADTIYVDNDGDGSKNDGDTFGYAYWNYHGTDVWVTAVGEKITSYEDGELKIELETEKVQNTLEKVIDIVYNTNGGHKYTDETFGRNEFLSGRVGIIQLMFEDCFSHLRDMEYNYGIMPYPKYDESQENYYTNSMDQHSVFGAPITLPSENYEFVGIMMEVLNAESYKTVYPAYYDTALKNKYTEDPKTAQMLDIIVDGRVYEFSFQFGEKLANLPYMFRYLLYDGSTDLSSKLAKSKKMINKALEKMYECYQ